MNIRPYFVFSGSDCSFYVSQVLPIEEVILKYGLSTYIFGLLDCYYKRMLCEIETFCRTFFVYLHEWNWRLRSISTCQLLFYKTSPCWLRTIFGSFLYYVWDLCDSFHNSSRKFRQFLPLLCGFCFSPLFPQGHWMYTCDIILIKEDALKYEFKNSWQCWTRFY